MAKASRVLLVEDDPGLASSVQVVLEDEGYEVTLADDGDRGLNRALAGDYDAVVTDLRLPGRGGLEIVRELRASKPLLPVILITAHGTTETAIEAMKSGAYDYLLKPFEMPELLELLGKAVATSRLTARIGALGEADDTEGDAIVGKSRAMQEVFKQVGRLAATPVTVLILGETGSGKELLARAIFQHSDRAKQPFIAVHCAAIPETLLESELFGHERGAFTGAHERRIGRFEQANGGTIFLDEIGDIPLDTQVKLLRVLQEKTVQRLGGRETISVNVRLLAATHRNIEEAVEQGRFREDLYYRINVARVTLPPLRERREDIPLLVHYFVRRAASELGTVTSVEADALEFLQSQSWPGNVRQLENAVRQAVLASRGYAITRQTILDVLAASGRPIRSTKPSVEETAREYLEAASRGEMEGVYATLLDQFEREVFGQAIRLASGNQSKAAKWLGVTRLTLREKLEKHDLHPNRTEPSA